MKTLAIILNHNLPELTDNLYDSLAPHQSSDFDLAVMDNGSRKDLVSVNTTYRLESNVFWGGALNEAFNLLLKDEAYDSLLFLNNDLELNPEVFVRRLREVLFKHDFAIVSPCIAGKPSPWRQMQSWGCDQVRIVKWIDNQAPLFHRRFVEEVKSFDESLKYGWGQELVCYDVCVQKDWKIGVCDFIPIIHLGQQTFVRDRLFSLDVGSHEIVENAPVSYEAFRARAIENYSNVFGADRQKFEELVRFGQVYGIKDIVTV